MAKPPTRTVIPARQPVCCNCNRGLQHNHQIANGEFRCDFCGGYLGYCGANGCDTGLDHFCPWKSLVQQVEGIERA